MTVPTKTVTIDVLEPNGTALSGAAVTARITGYDVYLDQIIERYTASTTTNGAGRATLALFPNTLGERETAYVFTIRHPTTGRKIYQTVARVPNEDVNLTDIAGNIETVTVSPPETVETGLVIRLENGTYVTRVLVANGAGIEVLNGDGIDGNPVVAITDDLEAIEALATSGLAKRTGTNTWSIVTIDAYSEAALALATAAAWQDYLNVVVGADVQAWDADLDALAALASTGLIVRSGSGTVVVRTLTAPAAGITVTNGSGVSGNPTLVLANDLAAIEALGSTGFAVRTASDTWSQRTITAGTGIGVTNGDGVSGNPAIAITDVELLAIAGLTSAADSGIYFTGSGTASLYTLTAAGRTLAAGASAAAQLTTLGGVPIAFLAGFISGLTWANNAGDATNDIDLAAGSCVDAAGTYMMTRAALTKRSDAAWAVGTGNGWLDTGAIGNGDYYEWTIARSDTGVVDSLLSLSSTAPTMPASYDKKKLTGWIQRAGGAIVAFKTYETEGGGIDFAWTTPTVDINLANTLTTARRLDALKVPLNLSTIAHVNVQVFDATAQGQAILCCPDQSDVAPSFGTAPLSNNVWLTTLSSSRAMYIRTNAVGQIAARADLATVDNYYASTLGFRWARRG